MLKELSSKRIDYVMGEQILQKSTFFVFAIVSINIIIRTSQIVTIYMVERICNIELQDQEESFLSLHIRPISCATLDGLA